MSNRIYPDYLMHYGILGMKWGIRRYQNKDGTLTPLGKKHAAALETKYERVTGKKIVPSEAHSKGYTKKNIDSMSNEELNERLTRLKIENEFVAAKQRREQLEYKPPKESKTSKFLKNVGKEAASMAKNIGTQTATKWLNEMWDQKWAPEFGLDTKSRAKAIKDLEEEIKEREIRKKNEYQKAMSDADWADTFKKGKSGMSKDEIEKMVREMMNGG